MPVTAVVVDDDHNGHHDQGVDSVYKNARTKNFVWIK